MSEILGFHQCNFDENFETKPVVSGQGNIAFMFFLQK